MAYYVITFLYNNFNVCKKVPNAYIFKQKKGSSIQHFCPTYRMTDYELYGFLYAFFPLLYGKLSYSCFFSTKPDFLLTYSILLLIAL